MSERGVQQRLGEGGGPKIHDVGYIYYNASRALLQAAAFQIAERQNGTFGEVEEDDSRVKTSSDTRDSQTTL